MYYKSATFISIINNFYMNIQTNLDKYLKKYFLSNDNHNNSLTLLMAL